MAKEHDLRKQKNVIIAKNHDFTKKKKRRLNQVLSVSLTGERVGMRPN